MTDNLPNPNTSESKVDVVNTAADISAELVNEGLSADAKSKDTKATTNLNDDFWTGIMPGAEDDFAASEPESVDSNAEEEPPVDAFIEVKLTPDKMGAFVMLKQERNGGLPVTAERIISAAKAVKITYGLKTDIIDQIVKNPKYGSYANIALGKPAIDGLDGVCRNHFATEYDRKPVERTDGSINFWDLNIVQNVKRGTLICTISAETDGEEGMNVLSETVIQRKGKPCNIPNGKNTMLNIQKTELTASCDGNLVFNSGKFNVDQIFEVKGDVDISTGNINFLGDVMVTGDVREGFSVHAKRNIIVKGMIEGAEIVAEGDVTVTGGMNGSNKGAITCKGELKCKYIENATIKVRGNITSEYIVNSNVMCDGEVELTGNRGLLIGGNYVILKKISAKFIGSQAHVPTNITLGAYGTILEEKSEFDKQLVQNDKDIEKIMQIINFLTEKKQQLGKLPDDKETLLTDAIRTKMRYILERSKLVKKLEELVSQLQYDGEHILSCSKTMYPGTRISIKSSTFVADREYAFCTIYYDADRGEIVVVPMRS